MEHIRHHVCLSCSGGIQNAKSLKGCITLDDGRVLDTVKEVKQFLREEIKKGHEVLPCGDCNNFDYKTGCKGHEINHIFSLSFGKDSVALLYKCIQEKRPIDKVIFCDIMFNDKISGEHPLMYSWITEYAEPKINQLLKDNGYTCQVEHITSKVNFTSQFYTIKQKGNLIGDNYGFPYVIGAWCNGRLKLDPIRNYIKPYLQKPNIVVEYIGIAKDEPKRLARYKELQTANHEYVTLADFNITEKQAFEICENIGLLSPKYNNSYRCGCWFCPKQPQGDLYQLWKDYPEYYNMLENMEKDSHNTFKPNETLKQIRQRFESGYIPKIKLRNINKQEEACGKLWQK